MNKNLLLASMALVIFFAPIFAEENDTVLNDSEIPVPILISEEVEITNTMINESEVLSDEVIDEDLRIMNIPEGIILRFSQLQDQIDINIQRGEKVIEYLNINHLEIDTTNLSLIIDELKLILDEVNVYTIPENIISIQSASEAFVELKTNTVNLFSDFKTEARSLLNESELIALRNRAIISRYMNAVKAKIQSFNKENIRRVSSNLGLNNASLNELFNGSMTKTQVMNSIRERIQNMNESRMNEVKINVRQVVAQNEALKTQIRAIVNSNLTQRIQQRVEERVENIVSNRTSTLINNTAQRLINKIQERLATRPVAVGNQKR